ncbi:MAG TPA: hypothetical protein VKU60_13285 [Chloroflexota bacterium]|nr:hypothetical protein [Chloroflexota bacterium]
MMRRTTLTAEAEDLDLFRREAKRRRVSLNQVLKELLHEAADARRGGRARPRFGTFKGSGEPVAQLSADDEDAPARGRLRS